MYVFVNELSVESQAKDRTDAQRLMKDLMSIIESLKSLQGEDPIRTSGTLWAKELFHDYTVQQWLNELNEPQMRWFKKVVRNGPYIETLLDKEVEYHECWYHGDDVSSTSIAGAVFFEGIVTSLQDSNRFAFKHLPLRYREGDQAFTAVDLFNVYDPNSVEAIIQEILETFRTDIVSWEDFWDRKGTLFPKLTFCECVKRQLLKINFEPINIKGIVRHLAMMNAYYSTQDAGQQAPDYTKMGIEASTETQCTLERYGYQRKFDCPDGNERLFDWHSKLRGQNLRIHFYPPDSENACFLIGYIGEHLKTCKYRH